MNGFDLAILTLVNGLVGACPELDRLVAYLTWQNSLKGGVLCALLWWAWFSGRERAREIVIGTIASSFIGVVLARFIGAVLWIRPRPLVNPELVLRIPPGINAGQFMGWSSFPSDHAVLFIGLATGICHISRRLGIAAIVYTIVVILFPRLYGGIHYPTDLIAGALLGAGLVTAGCSPVIGGRLARPLLVFEERYKAVFYPALFLI